MSVILPYPTFGGTFSPTGGDVDKFLPAFVHSDNVHNNPHYKLLQNDLTLKTSIEAVQTSLAGVIFTKQYNSGDQVITTNGTLTLTHGLGVSPKIIFYYLHCVVADNGFAPGDIIDANNFTYTAAGGLSSGLSSLFNATNIFIYYSFATSVFVAIHKTIRGPGNLVNTSWRLNISAFA